jgi:PAS domain S-box-containing protein
VECSIQGIVVHRNNRVVFANSMLARMFGFRSASQLLGTDSARLIAPEDRKRVVQFGNLRRAGKPAPDHYEFRGNHRSGKPMWLEARVRIVDWDGEPASLVTVVDITDRKQAEQSLVESEERFRNLVEGSLEGINVLQGHKLVFVNQAFADIFGYRNPAHVLRNPIWERFQAPAERRRMGRFAKNRVQGKPAPPRYEFQGLRRDGKTIWLEASVRRILWHGQPALQGTLLDITGRKRAQEALAASQELLRTVVDTIPQALFAKDRKSRYLLANREMSRFYGLEPAQLTGRTDAELAGAATAQTAFFRRTDQWVLRCGKPLHLPDAELVDSTGNATWRVIHKLPLRDPSGAVAGVVGVSQDVTAMRAAQAETAAQRRTLETVLDALPYPVSFKDRERRLRVVNKAFTETWRRPASDFVGKRIDEIPGLGRKLNAEINRGDRHVLRTGKRVDKEGVAIRTRDREVIRHIIKLPVRDAQGRVDGILTISEDITDRRKAEADLIASKRLLEQILANIPLGLSLVDKDLNVVAANEQFHDLLGFPQSMRGSGRPFADYVRFNAQRGEYGPGHVEALVAERVAVAKKFQPHRFERVRPSGPALEIRGNPLPGGGFVTTYMDITERRQAQEQLLANQRLLQTVLDSLPHSLTVKDDQGRYKLVNRTFAEFWHKPQEAFVGRKPGELPFIPPEYARVIDESDRPVLRNGETVDRTSRQVQVGGKPVFQRVIKLPVRGQDGRIEGVVAMIEDVSAQRQADEDLRASRRLLQMVFDVIPTNLFVKDKDYRFVMANSAQCAFYGLTPEQFSGLATEQLPGMYPDLLERTLAYDRQVLEQGMVTPVDEYRRVNAAGSPRWLRGVKLPLLDDEGRIIGLLGMAEDITEAKRAEEALEESRSLLRTVIDAIPVNLFVKDLAGRFVLVNRSQADLYGLEQAAMIGKTAAAMQGRTAEDQRHIEAWDQRVLASGEREEIPELTRADHQGQIRTLRGIKLPLRDSRGKLTGLIGMTQDITEQRRAALALQDSERRMRVLLDNAPIIIYSLDRDGIFTVSEGKELGTVGRAPGEVVGLSAFKVFAHLPERVAQLRRGLAGEAFSEETLVDGQWFDTRHEPIRAADGNVTGLVVVSTNVTQRHLAEEQAQAGRRLLRTVFDTIPHSLWVKDTGSRFLMVNRTQARFYGLTPQAMVGMGTESLPHTPPALAQTWRTEDQRVIEQGQLVETPLVEVPLREGGTGWFRLVKLPLRDEHGAVVGIVGLAEDITERRQATEALRASQRLLQAIFDTIPHRLWVKDVAGRYLLVNHAQARFYGLGAGQMTGLLTQDLPGLPSGLKQQLVAQDEQVIREGIVVDEPEFPFPTASGQSGWIRLVKLPLRNEAAEVIGAVGLEEDVTDRKRAELEARNTRRLLQTVFDTIPHDMLVKDMSGTYIMVNQAMASFYGLTPQRMLGMHTSELPGLTEAQRQALIDSDRQAMEGRQRTDSPAVLLRDFQGQEHWIHTIKYPLLDDQGQAIAVVGMGEDVTERKRHEEELWASRELLRTVFNTIPLYLNVKDRNSRFILANAAAARFEGMAPEEFPGLPTELLPNRTPEQIQSIVETDRQVILQGEAVDLGEYTRLDHAGAQCWLRGIKLPLRDEQGRVSGLLGIVEDITEHKRALEQLQASRHLLQTVFDALPLRVSVRDAEGRYVMVNRRMAEDHQRPPESFIGKLLWEEEGLTDDERERILSRVRLAMESGRPVVTPELPVVLPGKNRRLLRSTLVPLFDAQGTLQGTLGIGEDITERRKSELALLQAQKLESLGVLAGGIAHDFNNLLVTIMGNASLAVLKLPPAGGPLEELQQIEIAGQRAADLCRQMLSYAGKGRLEKQPVSINQLVQEMTQLLRVSLPKGAAVNFRLMPNLPLTEADPTQLRQVIMNLVINAGEAIGDQPGTILMATGVTHADKDYFAEAQIDQDAPEGDYVYLEVSDTGAGMDAQTRARIFDPFFTTKFTGRGLGLASVLGIVRGHGGGLKVYSEVGKGTSFKVLLPIASGAVAPVSGRDEASDWSGGGTVLVIDDEQAIRSVAARMLARLGFQVIEAEDGAQGVEILRNAPTPLTAALLDLTMPGLSGEETLRQLRRIDRRLPVILMSGYNEREVLDRFVGRDLAGFLQKPFKLDDLRDKLRELFQESADPGNTPSA